MKQLFVIFTLVFFVGVAAEANPNHNAGGHAHVGHGHHHHRNIRISTGVRFWHNNYGNGLYAGWGWYPYTSYWNYPVYGYSYYPYYNYAPYYATYGSIAYSPKNNVFGVAWTYNSQNGATNAASANCGVDDCKPVVWVQGGCAAAAQSVEGQKISWGYHTTKHQAVSNAMRACKYGKTPGCKAAAWVCSW